MMEEVHKIKEFRPLYIVYISIIGDIYFLY